MKREDEPSVVLATATQDGEEQAQRRTRWDWAEAVVWTDRMLQALEEGVKGGKWFSLMDKVYAPRNLAAAFAQVKRNKGSAGVDHVNIAEFEAHLEENLERLHEQLRTGTYRPQPVKRTYIPKLGSTQMRPLGIPTVRDRVVQTALRNALEPIFERDFAAQSYGFRPKRGCKDALREVAKQLEAGQHWVVDADIQSYFDTIPHDRLMEQVRLKVADGKVLSLIEDYLAQEVMDDDAHWTPEAGSPQGAVISPLLANIYLDALDHVMAQQGFRMVRYADDLVVLCTSETEAKAALEMVAQWMAENGLRLHPEKTRIVDFLHSDGFDFLGYHFQVSKQHPPRALRWPRKKSIGKLKDRVRILTRRTNGQSMECLIRQLRPILRGFFEYFKHSNMTAFGRIDTWVRFRLRSILRRRSGRRGRGRGVDHQRWPNAYFEALGLFSMVEARALAVQSL
jgi:RNA-directed DNA polymerase